MAKPSKIDLPRSNPTERLPWPTHPKELSLRPRLFRIHRINAYEWQTYVVEGNDEYPIGKPDLFDILKNKVAGVMRAEGQAEFLANKVKVEKDAQAENQKAAAAKKALDVA